MVYRPTVRYDDQFKDYVDALFHATELDRNQIFRLALFALPYTKAGKQLLKKFLKEGKSLPHPPWQPSSHGLWLNQRPKHGEGGRASERDVREAPADHEGGTSHGIQIRIG